MANRCYMFVDMKEQHAWTIAGSIQRVPCMLNVLHVACDN